MYQTAPHLVPYCKPFFKQRLLFSFVLVVCNLILINRREQATVACLSLRRPGFDPGTVHVRFLVDQVGLGQVCVQVLLVPSHFRSTNSPCCFVHVVLASLNDTR